MKNIVVLGAGFAGLRTAIKLEKKLKNHDGYRVVLVDKNSYHTYMPSLQEVATAHKGEKIKFADELQFESELANSVCFSISGIIKNKKIDFIKDEVIGINTDTRSVILATDQALEYEHCVLAFGSDAAHYDVEGAGTCCTSLKTVHDALRVRFAVETAMKKASEEDKKELRFITIGAGLTGFEITAEMAKWMSHLKKKFGGTEELKINIRLLDAKDKILSEVPDKMRKLSERRLKHLGIDVMTSTKITKVEPHRVTLVGGRTLPADIIIWGGGVKGLELFGKISGISLDKTGRVKTDEFLRAMGQENLFVAGDSAYVLDKKLNRPVPATAWAAEQQADSVAGSILNSVANEQLKEYEPKYPGFVSSAGGKYGVAHIYGITFVGFAAWVVKRMIDLKYILSLYPVFRGLGIWLGELRLFMRND